jgi:methylmalonyl-CoA carboxyltransferase large subunit
MTISDLEAQIAELTRRLRQLEKPEEISEEELLAISGAVAAFLGVKAHIKQIRLISGNAWAQQGRVSIQASHRLD